MRRFLLVILSVLVVMLTSCTTMGSEKASPELLSMAVVIDVPGSSHDDLFVKANSWMVDTFKSAKSVIQYTDKEAGIVKGKYVQRLPFGLLGDYMDVTSTVTVEIKEGKARVSFGDANYSQTVTVYSMGGSTSTKEGVVEDLKTITKVRSDWEMLAVSLESALTSQAKNW